MSSDRSATHRPTRPTKRAYDSSRRTRQAAQTRGEVLAAAVTLFNEQGWAATTLADVAEAAGVAVETIYSGFGSKKGLLRAAMDVAVVGDAAPVPFSEREEFLRLGRRTARRPSRAAAAVTAEIHERSSGVWHAIVVAAAGDAEVETWRAQLERGGHRADRGEPRVDRRPPDRPRGSPMAAGRCTPPRCTRS